MPRLVGHIKARNMALFSSSDIRGPQPSISLGQDQGRSRLPSYNVVRRGVKINEEPHPQSYWVCFCLRDPTCLAVGPIPTGITGETASIALGECKLTIRTAYYPYHWVRYYSTRVKRLGTLPDIQANLKYLPCHLTVSNGVPSMH
jgi:hypothetical protein